MRVTNFVGSSDRNDKPNHVPKQLQANVKKSMKDMVATVTVDRLANCGMYTLTYMAATSYACDQDRLVVDDS